MIILIAILGTIFGSFASLLSYRIDKSLIFSRSECVKCRKKLNFFNLIPILSWLLQRGKCANCKEKISARYPIIEFFYAIFFLYTYLILGSKVNIELVIILTIFVFLGVITIIDIERYYVPDMYQYLITILLCILMVTKYEEYLVFKKVQSGLLYLFTGIILWMIFYLVAKIDAIGIDDLKFLFIVGFGLGIEKALTFALITGIVGSIFGFLWQKIKNDTTFPFMPSLAFSFYVCLTNDKTIIDLICYLILI